MGFERKGGYDGGNGEEWEKRNEGEKKIENRIQI
jgi:hypothetical protein